MTLCCGAFKIYQILLIVLINVSVKKLFVLSHSQLKSYQQNTEAIVENYISHHSRKIMLAETDKELCQRQYVIGIYSCPQQIGTEFYFASLCLDSFYVLIYV